MTRSRTGNGTRGMPCTKVQLKHKRRGLHRLAIVEQDMLRSRVDRGKTATIRNITLRNMAADRHPNQCSRATIDVSAGSGRRESSKDQYGCAFLLPPCSVQRWC